MKNIKLIIEYDGSGFHGWQRQKSARTVQGDIENALCKILGSRVVLNGSGRTDAGVHALAQVANFKCDTHLGPDVFKNALNSLLGNDVVIRECFEADEAFHARYDVKSKVYHYRFLNRPVPSAICRQYAWFIRKPLDPDAMRAAMAHLPGSHDFKAFEGTGSPRSHTVRHVMDVQLAGLGEGLLEFRIEADGFLRYMVRNIVGTLVDAGHGKLDPDGFKAILRSRDRKTGGKTAPSRGLFLIRVNY